MDQLDKLVALKNVDAFRPTSGLFVDDLPGMSTELLQNLTNADKADLATLWSSIKRRARLRLVEAVETALSTTYDWSKTLFVAPGLRPLRHVTPVDEDVTQFGLLLDVPDATRLDLRLVSLQFVCSPSQVPVSVPLDLVDLDGQPVRLLDQDGAALDWPITVDLKPGFVQVDLGGLVDVPYGQARLALLLPRLWQPLDEDNQPDLDQPPVDVELVDLVLPDAQGFGMQPVALDLDGQEVPTTEPARLHLVALAECSIDKLVQRQAQQFARAWLYVLGAEILDEKVQSLNTNYFASGNLALTEENRDNLNARFGQAIKALAKRLDVSDLCASCEGQDAVAYVSDEMP